MPWNSPFLDLLNPAYSSGLGIKSAIERGDDSYIDIPAYVRSKPKPKA